MKYSKVIIFLMLLITVSCVSKKEIQGTSYYFDAVLGNDNNTGLSASQAWKSLSMSEGLHLKSGDKILLAKNQVFKGSLEIVDAIGSKENPILIASYGQGSGKAQIEAIDNLNALLIQNSSFVEVNNLSLTAKKNSNDAVFTKKSMRCGVLVKVTKSDVFEHIYLKNVEVNNVFYETEGHTRPKNEIKTANGTQNYGWGIRVINRKEGAVLKDVKIDSSFVENVGHTGIKFTGRYNENDYGIENIQVSNTKVRRSGGPGIQMSGVKNGHIFNNHVDQSGSNDDSRKWGRGSGLWTWGSRDILIEKNRFTNANGPGDSAGAHIDFNCNNVVLQYNFSANNAGGFCEILGNNYNCAYRYNISVNDGYRIKGKDGAFQEGKIFWLSGYVGEKRKRKGPFNSYFYNNTIYVADSIQAKIAVTKVAKGILIANNIFHIVGNAKIVKGDQYNPEKKGKWNVENVFFENNVFSHQSSWPKKMPIQDAKPIYGNANFKNIGSFSVEDYQPKNKKLIQNKGIVIPKISNDTIGIIFGLQMTKDILGNPIQGLPDIGAIEMQ